MRQVTVSSDINSSILTVAKFHAAKSINAFEAREENYRLPGTEYQMCPGFGLSRKVVYLTGKITHTHTHITVSSTIIYFY